MMFRNFRLAAIGILLLLSTVPMVNGQEQKFYLGVDLSYVNEMEDCGAVYRENGEAADPFVLFHKHGANLVRARLWHKPDWTNYSTLDDVKKTFSRAQAAGMSTLLDIHYSDTWADPGRQEIPAAWEDIQDEGELAQAVYDYTYDVLTELHDAGLVPTFVQVGNETNSGMLKRRVELDWGRDAGLFNAGIQAIRDFAAATGTDPLVMLHIAQPENTGWWFAEAEAAGVTDFDVIGLSYYPQWSTFTIADVGSQVSYLRQRFGKAVMVVETAYAWTREAVDETADNILNQGIRGYPFTPAGQRQFMTDLTQSLISNGALGVVYWEPAWVSTDCSTRWGQGSHWENATFFDFQNEVHEGIGFLSHSYLYPASLVDGRADSTDPLIEDDTADSLDDVPAFDLLSLHMTKNEGLISLAITVAGDVYSERGNYLIYFDTTYDTEGAAIDVNSRPITISDPYKPEYRLDIGIVERQGSVSGKCVLNAWVDGEWQKITFTGGLAIQAGDTSVIEIQIPEALLSHPPLIHAAVLSTDRTLAHTAADIMGSAFTPADWSEPVVIDQFFSVQGSPP